MGEIKPLTAYRKDIYDLFQEVTGRRMTEKQHRRLKRIFMSALKEHRTMMNPYASPVEHRITCPQCQGVKIKKGHSAMHTYMRKIKHAGGKTDEV